MIVLPHETMNLFILVSEAMVHAFDIVCGIWKCNTVCFSDKNYLKLSKFNGVMVED